MSFGESLFRAGFNQKTAKDLFVKGNYGIPPRKQRGKTLEDSRRRITEAEPEPLTSGVDRPYLQAGWPAPHVRVIGSTSVESLLESSKVLPCYLHGGIP